MEEERRTEDAPAQAESEQMESEQMEDLEPREGEAEEVKGGSKLNDLQ
jgi:hypothetical protein